MLTHLTGYWSFWAPIFIAEADVVTSSLCCLCCRIVPAETLFGQTKRSAVGRHFSLFFPEAVGEELKVGLPPRVVLRHDPFAAEC